MNNILPIMNIRTEKQQIIDFLKNTFKKKHIQNVVIGLSGGIDSMTCLYLLSETLPSQNIFVLHLQYFKKNYDDLKKIVLSLGIPEKNFIVKSIKKPVNVLSNTTIFPDSVTSFIPASAPLKSALSESLSLVPPGKISLGNIMSRTRMIILFDFAKKYNALVCGTENRTEHYLGYFTRFGDAASDIEPIQHLYKTQVFQLATKSGVPQKYIDQKPTAGLWKGQTDENEFGFTYEEADQVLYGYFEKKLNISQLNKLGFQNAEKIIQKVKQNDFKHKVPYTL
ncbi:MAG: NAD(+) synthase [bacterium]|nr:NAD(+) synthase [bacterium]